MPALCASPNECVSEPTGEFTALAKSAWARLIRKVYEADRLECPKCVGDGAIMYGFSRFENADVDALTPVRKQRIHKLRSVRTKVNPRILDLRACVCTI